MTSLQTRVQDLAHPHTPWLNTFNFVQNISKYINVRVRKEAGHEKQLLLKSRSNKSLVTCVLTKIF